jgi:hypothetical protein
MTAAALAPADGVNPLAGFVAGPMLEAANGSLFVAPAHAEAIGCSLPVCLRQRRT